MKLSLFIHQTIILPSIILLSATLCLALEGDTFRQHGTHVHGVASLNIALADNELFIEFESPAIDIVGFEHEPGTDEEKATFQKALGILRVGNRMFAFSPDAGVRLEKSVIKSVVHHNCEHEP